MYEAQKDTFPKHQEMVRFGTIGDNVSLLLYHGSEAVRKIEDIKIPGPRERCDFGQGFYLAESKHTAEEWVIRESTPIINSYSFSAPQKDILYLSGEDWIRVVVGFRTGKYRIKFTSPIIHGLIANDRMDIALAAFMDGTLGDKRLLESLNYCKLGAQFLLRQSTKYLISHQNKDLKGAELQRAQARWISRRNGMNEYVKGLFRKPVIGEKYIEDYIAGGDYIET